MILVGDIHKVLKAGSICKDPGNEGFGPAIGNRTAFMLDEMLSYHRPRYHIFGHWHIDLTYSYKGTKFICLDCMAPFDLDNILE